MTLEEGRLRKRVLFDRPEELDMNISGMLVVSAVMLFVIKVVISLG